MICRTDDEVDQAAGGAVFAVRLTEPIGQDAVFGDAIQDAVRTDDGGVHGTRENERTDEHDKGVEQQLQGRGADEKHG